MVETWLLLDLKKKKKLVAQACECQARLPVTVRKLQRFHGATVPKLTK